MSETGGYQIEARVVPVHRTQVIVTKTVQLVSNIGGRGPSNLYIGPQASAPGPVTQPILMVLRNQGAPALETALVVREP